jgi:2-octaprenyl-6-methoxyphenol hydroxylase
MDSDRLDLAVVGAGLNGSLLALAAGEAGLSTALIDRVPLKTFTDAGFDGRTTAIAYTSQRLFAALGVWPDLADQAEPILDIRISDAGHDGRPSPLFLHFDHREAAAEGSEPAPMGWIVENRFLRATLQRKLAACKQVELIAPDEVIETNRDPDRAELVLKSGRRLSARLVASAEGRLGAMREEAGIGARAWSYGQIAILLVARHERPHRGVAQGSSCRAGLFAMLPMRDGQMASIARRSSGPSAPISRAGCSSSSHRASRPSSRGASATIWAPSSPRVRAGGFRSGWSMPSAISTRGWWWWATPPTASIPSPARATISACATSPPSSRC